MSRTLRVGVALVALALAVAVSSLEYTVEPGDTLWVIARDHGVTVDDIVEANDITNPNVIYAGQTLVIPLPEAEAVYHTVQPGETLSQIAKRYNTTVAELAEVNGFPDPNLIYPGNRLLIGGEPPDFSPEISNDPESATYVVKKGDTLGRIAAAHDTTVSELASVNGISNPNLIQIGQTLELPAGSSSGWRCPVPEATFLNDWGFPRSGGRFHEGNDLFAPLGTDIHAPVSGVVTQVDGTVGGLQFWLEGDDGVLYIGTHMSDFGRDGRVGAGDVVGHVGNSGNARHSAPHLHFEIHPVYNEPVNPYPTLVAACT